MPTSADPALHIGIHDEMSINSSHLGEVLDPYLGTGVPLRIPLYPDTAEILILFRSKISTLKTLPCVGNRNTETRHAGTFYSVNVC